MNARCLAGTNPTDTRAFRETLGHYASAVTIIAGQQQGMPVGFTCQSFYSVSLSPPLVSFSVAIKSSSYPAVRESGRFSVNVLTRHQHHISRQFAASGSDKWHGIDWSPTANGNPIIADTLMWLDCEIDAEHPAGDHQIVIGRVIGMSPLEWHFGEPLIYFKGKYRRLRLLDDDHGVIGSQNF